MNKSVLTGILVALVIALIGVGVYSVFVNRSAPATPAAAPATAAGVVLSTSQTGLGTVVVDKDGFTLYRFDKDTNKPPKSNCNGDCAKTWPPVISDGAAPQLEGVDPKLVGTVDRADGTKQVTLNGWPLYRFAKDSVPGDTKGEGVGGTWHAIGVDGKPAKGAKAATSSTKPAPAPSTGGSSGGTSGGSSGGSGGGYGY